MIELCCEYLSVRCIWLYLIIISRTSFRVNLHSVVCLNVKELLARSRHHIWSLSDCNGIRTHNHLVLKRTLNHLAKLAKWLSCVVTNVTACIYCFDLLILTYSDFTFDNDNFDLRKRSVLNEYCNLEMYALLFFCFNISWEETSNKFFQW